MSKEWTLTIPNNIEKSISGNFGKAELTLRGVPWRIEIRANEANLIQPFIYRRDELRDWSDCPDSIKRDAHLAFHTLTRIKPQ